MTPNPESKNTKNRDIEKDEINGITKQCKKPREKAFFTIMRQSGLPPHTIKQLKIKHLEKILEPNTPPPCKITIPYKKTPTFIGHEAINYIKQYLAKRKDKLTPDSLLFTAYNNPNKEINTKDVSRTFRQATQELEITKKITLRSLINFYRKNAKDYLTELRNKNTPEDDEFYRELYKAQSDLEIEPATPMEIHRLLKRQQELEEKLEKIGNKILPKTTHYRIPPEDLGEYQKEIEEEKENEERIEYEKERIEWEKENPEEAKQRQEKLEKLKEEWNKRIQKYLDEHPDARIQQQRLHIEQLETRVNELEKTLREIKETFLKQNPD